MSDKLLKRLAAYSIFLMLIVIVISFVLSNESSTNIYANNIKIINALTAKNNFFKVDLSNVNLASIKKNSNSANLIYEDELYVKDYKDYINNNSNDKKILNEKYIVLNKPSNQNNIRISIEDLYMTKSIRVIVRGLESKYYDYNSIIRFNQNSQYKGKPGNIIDDNISKEEISLKEEKTSKNINVTGQGKITYNKMNRINKPQEESNDKNEIGKIKDVAKSINITYTIDETTKKYTAIIDITLDEIYAHTLYQDKNCFYINLSKPKDVYDKILVIDAGHGGYDVGTTSYDKKYYEKDLNLSIVKYLKELLDRENIKVYYTRLKDEKVYLNPRVDLANNLDADFFISIHCNASETDEASGTEVLYNETKDTLGMNSKALAKICLSELVNTIKIQNRGLANSDNIYIIDEAKVPIALIEVAYMSNPEDLRFLINDNNQRLVADGIYKAILKAYEELN